MKAPFLSAVLFALATTSAFGAQATSVNFYPLETIKPYTSFLGFDPDKHDGQDLQTRLQNSGTNWHCVSTAQRVRCPLNGDTGSTGSNVSFRAPHIGDGGATVSEFRVTLLAGDVPALSQLQPEINALAFLGQDWASIMFAFGKPTNEYDDGSTVQHLYCATRELPAKPGEPRVWRVYIMFINSLRITNIVTSVELAAIDQVLPPLAKPSC
jgi:hypothetical protein